LIAAQVAALPAVRPIEFHLAERKPAPGLVSAYFAGEGTTLYLHVTIELDDRDIQTASVVRGLDDGPAVRLRLKPSGVRKLNALADTYQRQFQRLAIVSNNRIISAPIIEGRTSGDSIDINGMQTQPEATAIVKAIAGRRGK
jgi:preprotein translocase subunit SecD